MPSLLEAIFAQQRRSGFPAFAGTDASATIPISDRLLSELIARRLPAGGPIGDIVLVARDRNQITARIRVVTRGIGLPVNLTFEIDSQPVLPERPVLGLRLRTSALLLTLSTMLARMFASLPPGISFDGERIEIDLRALLQAHDATEWLRYLTELRVTTEPGVVVLTVHTRIGPAARAPE
jgi:hypothetical protein